MNLQWGLQHIEFVMKFKHNGDFDRDYHKWACLAILDALTKMDALTDGIESVWGYNRAI